MKIELLKDVVVLLLPIVLCFNMSCNNADNNSTSNLKYDQSKESTLATVTTDKTSATSKTDTIYTKIYLEDSLKNYGHFGMTIPEWNKRLAILASEGVITDISEDYNACIYSFSSIEGSIKNLSSKSLSNGETAYKGYMSLNKTSGYSIEGVFRFAEINEVFIRDNKRLNEDEFRFPERNEVLIRDNRRLNVGVLIGIVLKFQMQYKEINALVNAIINNDKLKYLVGDKVPEININEPIVPKYYGYRVGDKYMDPISDRLDEFENKLEFEHEHNYSLTTEYMPLYEGKLFYSIIEYSEYSSATFHCQLQYKNNKNDGCVITSIENPIRDFSLTQIILSKNQSGIKVEDYLSEKQNNNVVKAKKKQDLIDKALNK